jgi:hypothetical protein
MTTCVLCGGAGFFAPFGDPCDHCDGTGEFDASPVLPPVPPAVPDLIPSDAAGLLATWPVAAPRPATPRTTEAL